MEAKQHFITGKEDYEQQTRMQSGNDVPSTPRALLPAGMRQQQHGHEDI
jgi:hypothetical protein